MSADKSMAVLKAKVGSEDDQHFIEIEVGKEIAKISMSEDKPNDVKSAFNKLIKQLKKGEYQIALEEVGNDLFSQVAKEYIVHLNREILEVHGEMKSYGLLNSSE